MRDKLGRFTNGHQERLGEKVSTECKGCGNMFELIPSCVGSKTFCSDSCRIHYWKIKIKAAIICECCSKKFYVKKSRKSTARFCSMECRDKIVRGEKSGKWKGGRFKSRRYIMIYFPAHPLSNSDGYVREHRLVMEKHLGRYLKPREIVHHIDKNPSNNNIKNLMLFSNHSNHVKHHQMVKHSIPGAIS